MDEPLGALDRQLRKHVQLEIRRLHRTLGRTTLYVTHDHEEALVMSDRIGVMRDGRIEQIGPPDELYRRPAHVVACFLSESNILTGRVTSLMGAWHVSSTPTSGSRIAEAGALVRPEAVTFSSPGEEGCRPASSRSSISARSSLAGSS